MTTGAALEAIVLAAGAGSRAGGGKLGRPWRGAPLLAGALAAAFAAPVRRVVVVSGADPRIPALARTFAQSRGLESRLVLVEAADHAEGMAASLRVALAALPDDAAAAFVFLGDMPRVPHGVAARLVEALGGAALAAAPVFEGRRGHPVLFASGLFGELAELRGDRGARDVLDRLGSRLALVETDDPGVLFDVDRPADFRS